MEQIEEATVGREFEFGTLKKRYLSISLLNGGNDEARTRDLMRDRHAL